MKFPGKPFALLTVLVFLLSPSLLQAQQGSAPPKKLPMALGLDASGGISSGAENNFHYTFRPWVGWLRGAHTTLGIYGQFHHRPGREVVLNQVGLGAFGSYELWPARKVTPYARLGAGALYAHSRTGNGTSTGLYPVVSPELGLRWHLSSRFSIGLSYRYDWAVPNNAFPSAGGGHVVFGVRFRF